MVCLPNSPQPYSLQLADGALSESTARPSCSTREICGYRNTWLSPSPGRRLVSSARNWQVEQWSEGQHGVAIGARQPRIRLASGRRSYCGERKEGGQTLPPAFGAESKIVLRRQRIKLGLYRADDAPSLSAVRGCSLLPSTAPAQYGFMQRKRAAGR